MASEDPFTIDRWVDDLPVLIQRFGNSTKARAAWREEVEKDPYSRITLSNKAMLLEDSDRERMNWWQMAEKYGEKPASALWATFDADPDEALAMLPPEPTPTA